MTNTGEGAMNRSVCRPKLQMNPEGPSLIHTAWYPILILQQHLAAVGPRLLPSAPCCNYVGLETFSRLGGMVRRLQARL